MFARKREGATLGLVASTILIIALIGTAFYYMAEFFGGSKQLMNGTDSGALGAARQVLTVGLSQAEVNALPVEFQALGVDSSGAPTGIDSNGVPNTKNAIFNVYAFNRAAGLTLLVALNAAEDGSPAAIANANNLITALNTFGTELNSDLANAPQLSSTFSNLAASNNYDLLGTQTSVSLGNNGDLQFASVPGEGGGQANIYFNNVIYTNDPTLQGWIHKMITSAGPTSQVNSRYNQNDPSAQAGQSFVLGYQPLDMSAITSVPGFTPKIFTCAVNPLQLPHMIDSSRFNNPGTPTTCYAPHNSIAAQGQATTTYTGAYTGPNLLCTALACAMLGAYDNQYPINMPYGWIRIQNGKDAIAANPSLSPVPLYAGNGENIYNIQTWTGPGGKGGIWSANNGVFCTEAFDNQNDLFDTGPISGYSGYAELSAWVTYNTTPCTGNCVPDVNGHNPALNPNLQQPDGTYILGYKSPSANIRGVTIDGSGNISSSFNQLAPVTEMLGVTSIPTQCTSYMYQEAGSTPPACAKGVNLWSSNYFTADYWVSPTDKGTQPTGGLTNLEYVKGEVIGALDNLWIQTGGHGNKGFDDFTYTLNVGQNPAGSKVYDHSGQTGYATPGGAPGGANGATPYGTALESASVAFGTIATPFDLIDQLSKNQPTGAATNCADTSSSSTQWTDVSTPLGRLLQRCQMIVPSTTGADVVTLLKTYKIDLNQYQYIYLPVGATKLVISNSPPAFLKQFPEYNTPGSTLPDGTAVFSCKDAIWDKSGNGRTGLELISSLVNSKMGVSGNASGDDTTNGSPFSAWSGNLSTWDGLNWTSNSGRYFFLGQMSFGNYVSGNGDATTFSQPN